MRRTGRAEGRVCSRFDGRGRSLAQAAGNYPGRHPGDGQVGWRYHGGRPMRTTTLPQDERSDGYGTRQPCAAPGDEQDATQGAAQLCPQRDPTGKRTDMVPRCLGTPANDRVDCPAG